MDKIQNLLDMVYTKGQIDNWSGGRIGMESEKVHDTIRLTITQLTQILTSSNTSAEDRKWAREKLNTLI